MALLAEAAGDRGQKLPLRGRRIGHMSELVFVSSPNSEGVETATPARPFRGVGGDNEDDRDVYSFADAVLRDRRSPLFVTQQGIDLRFCDRALQVVVMLFEAPARLLCAPADKSEAPMRTVAILAVILLAVMHAHAAEIISGVPRIVDGDTLAMGAAKIRLAGIDAPESDQICLDARGARWTCGIEARDRLVEHIGTRAIDCTPSGSDAYHRTLAVCSVAGEDLNAWMVRQGWALAFIKYSQAYRVDETTARDARRGLWSGAFIAPWDWRHRGRQTTVLGAVAVGSRHRPSFSRLIGGRCAVPGLHHQGQCEPQGRAHLSCSWRTGLREDQHGRARKAVVLY